MRNNIIKRVLLAGAVLLCTASGSMNAYAKESVKQETPVMLESHALQYGYLLEDYEADVDDTLLGMSQTDFNGAVYAIVDALEAGETYCDLSPYGLKSNDEIVDVVTMAENLYPKSFIFQKAFGVYSGYSGIQLYYIDGYEEMIATYDEKVAQIVALADPSWSDIEKALFINDYLCKNCAYDETLKRTNAHNSYGAIVENLAVCQGYSIAFIELANRLGLSCEVVTSDSINHAWNAVKIGTDYYYVDATWNDPTPNLIGRARHVYFLKSYDYFVEPTFGGVSSHMDEPDWLITGDFSVEALANKKYDDYFWNTIDTGMGYSDGYWYGGDTTSDFSICSYTTDGKDFSKIREIKKVTDHWPVIDEPGYVWGSDKSGLQVYNGNLYYTDKSKIYMYDLKTSSVTTLYTLSEEELVLGYIYGLNIDSYGNINYLISFSPQGSDIRNATIKTMVTTCNISYVLDGGTNHASNPAVFDNKADFTLLAPEKENYSFEGWYLDSAFTKPITTLIAGECGNITLYAKWRETTHTFGEWEVVRDASCYKKGEKRRYCLTCDAYESEDIEMTEHSYGIWKQTKAPTCKAEGQEQRKCTTVGCSASESRPVAVVDHSYGEWEEYQAPSCYKEGESRRVCIWCDDYESQKIDMIEHNYGEYYVRKAATCNEKGLEQQDCLTSGCTAYNTRELDMLAHSLGEWIEDVAPGCESSGSRIRSCSNCEYKESEEVMPLGHSFVMTEEKLPTYRTKGHSAGSACARCGIAEDEELTIPELTFSVLFDGNGAAEGEMTVQENLSYLVGGSLLENTYELSGYEFVGWNSQSDGLGSFFEDGTDITKLIDLVETSENGSITLYAQWKRTTFSIFYELDGGLNAEANPDTYSGETVFLQKPTKPGFTFVGWYLDSQKTIAVSELDGLTEDVTIYAKWSPNKYKLQFDGNGATSGSMAAVSGTYHTGDCIPANAFKKTGYTFNGWLGSDGNTYKNKQDLEAIAVSTKASLITLTAKWKLTTYTITYNMNGGTNNVDNPLSYKYNSATITLLKPTKRGYDFAGWFSDSDCTKQVTQIPKKSTGNKTFYAKWKVHMFSITYVLNGGVNNSANPDKYKVSMATFTLASPTRKGYTFRGWYTDTTYTTAVTEVKKGTVGNKTFYAKWAKTTYTITYVLNGGTNNSKNIKSYNISTETFVFYTPKKTGYQFAGWYTDKACTNRIKELPKGSTGNKTLYAKWKKL